MKRRAACAWLAGLACPQAARAQAAEARSLDLERFDAIEISGSGTVRFRQGDAERVDIEGGGDDAQMRELFQVRDGRLRIHLAGAWRFWSSRRPRIEVTARDLTRVAISGAADFVAPGPVRARRLAVGISGSGSVRFEQLDADALGFDVSGSGDGHLAGTVRELMLHIAGRGDVDAERLRAERATVSISGVGDVRLWAVRELAVSVAGAGRVDYWGSPSVRRSVAGAATLTARGAPAGQR